MELNGIANMLIILDQAKENGTIDETVEKELREQVDTLHRYMIAYHKAVNPNNCEPVPYWHEVRDNPELYGKER